LTAGFALSAEEFALADLAGVVAAAVEFAVVAAGAEFAAAAIEFAVVAAL
jgi:hypothetical protein